MSVIGVCSWSLQPRSARELVKSVRQCGLRAVQLALKPLRRDEWQEQDTALRLEDAGIAIRSGMMSMDGEDYSSIASIRRTGGVRPDERWAANLADAERCAEIAGRLDMTLVSFHAGFLPESRGNPERATMLERVRSLADVFARHGIELALETGQETADTLLDVLAELDRPDVGVNFDPANMLLYGMGDPVEALSALAPHVRQIHVKDARASGVPDQWGEEVPVGEGEVDWRAFFDVIAARGLDVDLMIEREAGKRRVRDVGHARKRIEALRGADPR
ncbi:MAG: sugar phosphate isomerase/epimerase family protein [Planctomycetota bacterium]|jgi:sugar phosphate isomerase/epimerase